MTKVLMLLALCWFVVSPSLGQPGGVPVVVSHVREHAVVRSIPIAGRVFSRNEASLSTTVAGQLDWVAEPGTLVSKGDLLARMDEAPIELRRVELENLAAREEVNQRYLEKEVRRLQQLRETNSASQRLLDEAEANRDLSREDIATIETRIRQSDDELRRSRVVAGFDGVVTHRYLKAGEYVRPGDSILRLVDVGALEIRFQVPVAYLGRLAVGDRVTLESREGGSYEGRVRTLIQVVDENSQTFEARVDPAVPSNMPFVAGQLMSVNISLAGSEQGVLIPRDAVVLREDGSYVFRIGQDNVAERISVTLGEGERDWVSVQGALSRGDRVAIRGIERLQPGQTVVPADS